MQGGTHEGSLDRIREVLVGSLALHYLLPQVQTAFLGTALHIRVY